MTTETQTVTITVRGRSMPVGRYVRILTSDEFYNGDETKMVGPVSAFDVKEGLDGDLVTVIRPDRVTAKVWRSI